MKNMFPIDQRKVSTWLDKLTFKRIFVLWITVIIIYGVLYKYLTFGSSHLLYTATDIPVQGFIDNIYFSFVTATTTGFGDIVPIGHMKMVAIFEVITGLLLLALVTSKLVSLKQDVLLSEIYEMSVNEQVNRLRSSLLLFRQNLTRLIGRFEAGNIKNRDITDLHLQLSPLEEALRQVFGLFSRKVSNYAKRTDHLNAQLLFNSTLQSLEKIEEMANLLDKQKVEWRHSATLAVVKSCLELSEQIFHKLELSGLDDKNISECHTHLVSVQKILNNRLHT